MQGNKGEATTSTLSILHPQRLHFVRLDTLLAVQQGHELAGTDTLQRHHRLQRVWQHAPSMDIAVGGHACADAAGKVPHRAVQGLFLPTAPAVLQAAVSGRTPPTGLASWSQQTGHPTPGATLLSVQYWAPFLQEENEKDWRCAARQRRCCKREAR